MSNACGIPLRILQHDLAGCAQTCNLQLRRLRLRKEHWAVLEKPCV